MVEKKPQIEDLLKNSGLKATPQRLAVYGIMGRLGHASADMVRKEALASGYTFTLATVYNTLETLAGAGLLTKRLSPDSKMFFDVNTYNHCHLYDVEESEFTDYNDQELVKLVEGYIASRKPRNFEWSRVDIQIMGRKKRRKQTKSA